MPLPAPLTQVQKLTMPIVMFTPLGVPRSVYGVHMQDFVLGNGTAGLTAMHQAFADRTRQARFPASLPFQVSTKL